MSDPLSVPDSPSQLTDENLPKEREQFIRFHLEPETTALLPILQLGEVLNIPINQIVPIFQMPAWVMGVYNWRGEILWVVDLGQLVGLTPCYQQSFSTSTYTTIILHAASHNSLSSSNRNQVLGIIVNQIEEIEWCNLEQIQSPPSTIAVDGMLPFLRGYWMKSDEEMLAIIDGEAILAAMPKPNI